jgi:hypothetical protein
MQRVDEYVLLAPSNLKHFVACEHLTTLATDGLRVAQEMGPQAETVLAAGSEHEQAWLQRFGVEGTKSAAGKRTDIPGSVGSVVILGFVDVLRRHLCVTTDSHRGTTYLRRGDSCANHHWV